jgi:hypothetical protein
MTDNFIGNAKPQRERMRIGQARSAGFLDEMILVPHRF